MLVHLSMADFFVMERTRSISTMRIRQEVGNLDVDQVVLSSRRGRERLLSAVKTPISKHGLMVHYGDT